MPVQVSGDNLIYLGTAEINVVGQHWNSSLEQFEPVYYYAVLDDRNVVERVEWKLEEQTATDTYRSITFEQYQTITGLYWNGSEYVTPPISILAKASTDEVNYKDQNKWLSTKLDEMEADISANETDISTLSTDVSTIVSSLTTVSQNLSALATAVEGKANAVHTHAVADVTGLETALSDINTDISDINSALANKASTTHSHAVADITGLSDSLIGINGEITDLETAVAGKANASHTHAASDLSGVVKTVNGNSPDANGNIVVSNSGMTASEILTALETVDGSGSGLDADKLDGLEASAFALAGHNHDSEYAGINHVHTNYASVSSVNAALAGKSDTTHNHNGTYAPATHTHAQYLTGDDIDSFEFVTSEVMTEALADKADSNHNHSTVYAPISHSHSTADVTGLTDALAGKASSSHNHDTAYAAKTHTHNISDVTGLTSALSGKSDTNHTHSGYASATHTHSNYALATDVSDLEETVAGKANASHTHAQSDVTGLTAALNGKANSTHTHSQSAITGLTEALSGKADASHTHSEYFSTNGGAVEGDVNVKGILRVNGNQAYYHQTSTNTVTIGTNNAVGVTVACASSGETAFNAGTVKTYNINPRNANCNLGDSTNRWKGVYSQTTVNVSSDERLKEGIYLADDKLLSDFVRDLEVVSYNYIGDDKDRIGLIAQKVIAANPDVADYLVDTDENGYYNIRPADFVFPLIASVKELWKEIERIKSSK